MATKKRTKGNRAKTPARPRATSKAKVTTKKAAPRVAAKAAKTSTKVKATAKTSAKPVRSAGAESAELASLKSKFQRERGALERRLTETVREIGVLRHHELRAMQLERLLAERDATIGRLQTQLSDLERRPGEPIYVREVQQSLALGTPAHDVDESAADLDEFEDDRLAEDADLVNDDE